MPTFADYDFWLLDLDGTLVDTEWSYKRQLFDRVAGELGCTFTDDLAESIWHGLDGAPNDLLRERGVDPGEFWGVFDRLDDPDQRAAATYLYDDVSFVAELDAPVGLVTHCPPEITPRVLTRLGIRDWFDAVVCSTEELGYKPDPAPVRAAMADLDVTDDDAGVLVGDNAGDVGAAWNAGIDGVHIERHDPHRRGRCILGDHRISSFSDLGAGTASD